MHHHEKQLRYRTLARLRREEAELTPQVRERLATSVAGQRGPQQKAPVLTGKSVKVRPWSRRNDRS